LPGQPPLGIAVTLVRGPRIVVRLPCLFARLGHRVDKAAARQQRVVERRREDLGGIVGHGPSRRDDATDTDLDQLLGDTGGKFRAVELSGTTRPHEVFAAERSEVAAVHEHERRDRLHVADLARPEERAVRQHHAPRIAAERRLTVAGDMYDAPGSCEQRVDDLACIRP
jgi:hypothetical protein